MHWEYYISVQAQTIKKNCIGFFVSEGHEVNKNTNTIVRDPLVFTVFVVIDKCQQSIEYTQQEFEVARIIK